MPEKPSIDIRPDHWEIVRGILQKHVPHCEVWAFGSRAKWIAKEYSDLDLALITDQPLLLAISAKLSDDFSESDLPWKVDVVDWATTSESFRKIIEQDRVVIQKSGRGGVVAGKWRDITLGDFISLQRGHDLTEPERRIGRVPVLGSAGQNGFHDTALAKGPGIVIGRSGASFGQVHFSAVDYWPHNTGLYVTDFKGNDPRFAFYFLKALDFERYNSGSAQPSLNRNFIYPISINVPELAEQKAIASILGALDDKIELNRRMNATLEAMARALFKSWFVDFDPVRAKLDGRKPSGMDDATAALFPSSFDDSELGHIPKGWKVGRIKDCCTQIQNGGTPRRNEPRFWTNGTIPWLTSGEVRQSIITVTENFISEEGMAESSAKWVPAFSTVIALYGATAGQVSFTSCPLTTNQAVCSLIPKKDLAFFNYLTMRSATTELENKAVGSAQQNISKGIVEESPVVLPPDALVKLFTKTASPIFEHWISNVHQSHTLATLRDTLLPKLLSGELRIAEVASKAGATQ